MRKTRSNKAKQLGERHLAVLRLLAEYKYLTCRDLWLAVEPQNKDATSTSHKMKQLVEWGFVRAQRINIQRGGANPIVYSLLRAGADAIGLRLGSQFYRHPSPEQIQLQSFRLRLELQLHAGGYQFIRPKSYNSRHVKPALTQQSRFLIKVIVHLETEFIDTALRRLKISWWKDRWQPVEVQPSRVYPSMFPESARSVDDADSRDWLESQEEERQLLSTYMERRWESGGVYNWLGKHNILSPWDVPEEITKWIVQLNKGNTYSHIPRQLNDYVAGHAEAKHRPILLVACPPNVQRQQITELLDKYKLLTANFPCVFVFGDTVNDRLSMTQVETQVRTSGCIYLAVAELGTFLAQHHGTVAIKD